MFKYVFHLFLFIVCLFAQFLEAEPSLAVPTPFVNSINVMTGQLEGADLLGIKCDYYVQGANQVGEVKVQLAKGDLRIGRIKAQAVADSKQEPIYFFYSAGATEVVDHSQRKTVYRYSPSFLIEAVEHYEKQKEGIYSLYRKEKIFWKKDSNSPLLSSRVLEDGQGKAILCTHFSYNDNGQLIRETLSGNLSGICPVPLIIQEDGTPQLNGIENYSTVYRYSSLDPALIASVVEDNGLSTTYHYDPKTKQCLAKLKGHAHGLLSRAFYSYDDQGLLSRTVIDDGQGQAQDDLTGVTNRQIMVIQSCQTGPSFAQPLATENRYFDLASSQEVLLDRTLFTYSPEGALIQQDFYDAEGRLRYYIHLTYDENGHLAATVDSRGEVAQMPETPFKDRFNEEGLRTASIDAYGNETTYQYDAFGRLIETCLPAVLDEYDQPVRLTLSQAYNECDQVVQVNDAQGGLTLTSYTIRGKPAHVDYPDGTSESFVYNLDGELREKVAKNGVKTILNRDKGGRVICAEERAANGELLRQLCYAYQGSQVASLTDGKDFTIEFEYDGAGRQIRSLHKTADGVKRIEWSYDASGQRIQTCEWFGGQEADFVAKIEEKDGWQQTIATRLEDAQGSVQRRIESDKPSQKKTVFTQDLTVCNPMGQYVKLSETVDEKGTKELNTYDALQRLESCVQLNSLGEKISERSIRYNASGQKVLERHIVFSAGKETGVYSIKWSYDACNHLLAVHEAAGSPLQKTTRYQYDEKGNLTAIIKPDGATLAYTYNAKNLLATFQASDQSFAYAYEYDSQQRLIAVRDLIHDLVQTRRYNAFDEIVEENLGSTQTTLGFSYDLAGRRTEIRLPDASRIRYRYDGSYLIAVERIGADEQFLYQHRYYYHSPSGKILANDLICNLGSLSYRYDGQERLIAIESPYWSENIEEMDSAGRLLSLTTDDPEGSLSHSYAYADDSQLIEESGPVHKSYRYDSLYNRLEEDGQEWSVNALNQLTHAPAYRFAYDQNGNLVEKKGQEASYQYEYDALNRLVRAVQPGSFAIHYLYDAFDRCLRQEVYGWNSRQSDWQLNETSYFIYDGQKEIGKLNEAQELVELRVLGLGKGAEISAAVAVELDGELFAPIHDHQGSIRCLIDAHSKEVAEFYRFSAFGLESIYDGQGQRLESSSIGNPWRFSSKRTDQQTKLVSFGKRYYDPQIGRWISPDPLFFYDTPNLYAFVRNDSINHYDLYGLFSISDIWDTAVTIFFESFRYLQTSAHNFKIRLNSELKLPEPLGTALERIGRKLFGDSTYLLMGHTYERTEVGCYGQKEISDKVRVTFINGILTTRDGMLENLELISQSHGGVKVHYIFRPTEGWTWDVSRAMMVKMAFQLGFRSLHAHLLAAQWRALIHEMGGVGGCGTIIHYAHSLGGSETDRARELLSLEEQKMIRVITFGSATLIRNEGFQSVTNIISVNDGVSSILLEPLGHVRNFFDPQTNVKVYGSFFAFPCWPTDHLLGGYTYAPFIRQFGEQFLAEFGPS